MASPFDSVLLVAFGGPQGRDDIRPFLANVLKGRRVPPHRVEEVARHYERFDGISPITDITKRQAAALAGRLAARGAPLPVFVGMRNWHPLLADTLTTMARAGLRRAVGVIAAAHQCYSSCGQYRENVRDARRALVESGERDVDVTFAGSWYDHAGFVAANARQVRSARERLPASLRSRARLVFTAHSIPLRMADASRYREQLAESARLVARAAGFAEWALVYQSRSGRPEDPWLEPDVCDYLRAERARGLDSAVLCPIGFVADHVEVLYDLDHEAALVCRELGLPVTRASAVNDAPEFIDALADVVIATLERYGSGRPLEIAKPDTG